MSLTEAYRRTLAALVEVPSVSTPGDQRRAGRAILDRCETLLGPAGRRLLEVVPADAPEHPARVWELGRGEPALQFAGHLDTVPAEAASWSGDPWRLREEDARWLGLGVADMKGALAGVVVVWHRLVAELGPPRRALRLVATTDEESGMAGARALAERGALLPVPTILGEPTGGRRWYGHRGIVAFRCRFAGVGGHAGLAAAERRSVAYRAFLAFAFAFECFWRGEAAETQDGERSWSGNLGRIATGDAFNRIAPDCLVEGEVRFPPPHRASQVAERLRALAAAAAREVGVEATWEAFVCVDPFDAGAGDDAPWAPYASEAGFFPEGGRYVTLWGPGEVDAAHRPDEWLSVAAASDYLAELEQWLRARLW